MKRWFSLLALAALPLSLRDGCRIDMFGPRPAIYGRAWQSGTQSLTSATWTLAAMDTTDGTHHTTDQTKIFASNKYTIKVPGKYAGGCNIDVNGTTITTSSVALSLNGIIVSGTPMVLQTVTASVGGGRISASTGSFPLAVGDTVECDVFITAVSGAATTSASDDTAFWIQYVGP